MGFENVLQFPAEEDGCIYMYDPDAKQWRKLCDVPSPRALPESVKRQISDISEKANLLAETTAAMWGT